MKRFLVAFFVSAGPAFAQVPVPVPPAANPPCTNPTLTRAGLVPEFIADFNPAGSGAQFSMIGIVDGFAYPAGYTPPNLGWIANPPMTPQCIDQTPWNGDFGGVGGNFNGDRFAIVLDIATAPGAPAQKNMQVLQIKSSPDSAGNWHGGILSTLDGNGAGFHTRGGGGEVLECTAKLPAGIGQWPACWANGFKWGSGHELDFMETYGGWPASVHFSDHCWGCSPVTANEVGTGGGVRLDPVNVYQTYRNYAVEILPSGTEDFYVDGVCVGELVPTNPADSLKPMGLLIDLASDGGWGTSGVTNPSYAYFSDLRASHR